MNVTIVPSSVTTHRGDGAQFSTSYLINGVVAIDAGSIGLTADIDAQARVAAVFLSHSHLDHVGSLPMLLDNVYRMAPRPPKVFAGRETLDVLASSVFTRETWMGLDAMSRIDPPFVTLETLEPWVPIELEGLRITPIPVDHVIPTFGFLVEGPGAAVLFSSDTGPTDRRSGSSPTGPTSLRAIFVEASFPNALEHVAHASGHLTRRHARAGAAQAAASCPHRRRPPQAPSRRHRRLRAARPRPRRPAHRHAGAEFTF